jgi:hypothetical protein
LISEPLIGFGDPGGVIAGFIAGLQPAAAAAGWM